MLIDVLVVYLESRVRVHQICAASTSFQHYWPRPKFSHCFSYARLCAWIKQSLVYMFLVLFTHIYNRILQSFKSFIRSGTFLLLMPFFFFLPCVGNVLFLNVDSCWDYASKITIHQERHLCKSPKVLYDRKWKYS